MSIYGTEYTEGYLAWQQGLQPGDCPYLTDADPNKAEFWNQGWVDALNNKEGTFGNLMPGGSTTAGQGGGLGNEDITVNPDGTVTSTPRPSIAPDGLGSKINGNVIPLPIFGSPNIAGDLNVGGKFYANEASIIDDTLDVRLALTGHDTVTGTALIASGLAGSTAAGRYVGTTATGHPATGPHLKGDWCGTQDGYFWICTVDGTPGTWRQLGLGGSGGSDTTAWHNTGDSYGANGILGTGDNYDMVVESNGTERMRVRNTGRVEVGTPGRQSDGVYLAAAFSDFEPGLQILYSVDGLRYESLSAWTDPLYTPNAGELRDPSITRYNGRYWVCHTNTTRSPKGFDVLVSDDLVNWSLVTTVDSSGAATGVAAVWAPEWFIDDDGSVHVTVSIAIGGDNTNFRTYEVHPTNTGMTAWSSFTQITQDTSQSGSAWSITSHSFYDSFMFKVGSTYYLAARAYAASPGVDMVMWSSSSLTSGYLNLNVNMISDGANYEGISIVQVNSSTWRAYLDKKVDQGIYYMQSTDSGVTWTSPDILPKQPYPLNQPTFVRFSDLNTLRTLLAAIATVPTGVVNVGGLGRAGISLHSAVRNAGGGDAFIDFWDNGTKYGDVRVDTTTGQFRIQTTGDDLALVPFGGKVGIGLTSIASSVKLHNAGNERTEGYGEYAAMTAPATPTSGFARLYAKTVTGITALYVKWDDGTETKIGQLAPHASTHLPNGTDAIDWSGTIHGYGTHAARPAASASNGGSLYAESDTQILYRSNGSSWDQIGAWGASSGSGSGGDHLHGLARWVASGGTTFEAVDIIEYIEMVYDNGSAVDSATIALSSDRTQLVFASAPAAGHVIQATYVIARI